MEHTNYIKKTVYIKETVKILSCLKFGKHTFDIMLINNELKKVFNSDTWEKINLNWFSKRFNETLKKAVNLNDNYAAKYHEIHKKSANYFNDNNISDLKICLDECNIFLNNNPELLCQEIKIGFKNLINNLKLIIKERKKNGKSHFNKQNK